MGCGGSTEKGTKKSNGNKNNQSSNYDRRPKISVRIGPEVKKLDTTPRVVFIFGKWGVVLRFTSFCTVFHGHMYTSIHLCKPVDDNQNTVQCLLFCFQTQVALHRTFRQSLVQVTSIYVLTIRHMHLYMVYALLIQLDAPTTLRFLKALWASGPGVVYSQAINI